MLCECILSINSSGISCFFSSDSSLFFSRKENICFFNYAIQITNRKRNDVMWGHENHWNAWIRTAWTTLKEFSIHQCQSMRIAHRPSMLFIRFIPVVNAVPFVCLPFSTIMGINLKPCESDICICVRNIFKVSYGYFSSAILYTSHFLGQA